MQKAALSALPAVRALGRHAGRDPLTLLLDRLRHRAAV